MESAEQAVLAAATSVPVNDTIRIICPVCGPGRKHKNPTLSVTVESDAILYKCHHCNDFEGAIPLTTHTVPVKKVTQIPTKLNRLKQDEGKVVEFFKRRGINLPELHFQLVYDEVYFPSLNEKRPAVGFVYGDMKNPEAVKWRPADGTKTFTQSGAARSFYGVEQAADDHGALLITEGEADAVALGALFKNVVSVPNGAPMKVSRYCRVEPEEDRKFGYIWEARDLINKIERIVLVVDNDGPGQALAEEIARRVGRAKCWTVSYPDGCKDPTDVLAKHGDEVMKEVIKSAKPMPLQGVYSASDYKGELIEVYKEGYSGGESTGYPMIDRLFTVKEGMLYIVTGYPSAGKSEFVDQVFMNLAVRRDWKFAVASFENPPAVHIAKLSEKYIGKPFHEGPCPRMSFDDLMEATRFIDEHFVFLENKDGNMPTVHSIIDRAKQAVMRLGIRGLVIDPYNYIQMENREQEYQSISDMLSEMSAFARAYGVAIFFVAHPTKVMPREDGCLPIPKGNHISGGASWWAKADVGLTVHRGGRGGAEVHCWKSRFKWLGSQGDALLAYDVPTGRYYEPDGFKRSSDTITSVMSPNTRLSDIDF